MYTLSIVKIINIKRRYIDSIFKPLGLSRIQWQILGHIYYGKEPMTQKELNKLVEVDAGFVARVLDKLEKANYIKRTISKSDRRQRDIFLTAKGKRIGDTLKKHDNITHKKMFKNLSKQEQELVITLTEKIEHNLEEGE
jgi:DNA-binding MarR family transcriptional regulator